MVQVYYRVHLDITPGIRYDEFARIRHISMKINPLVRFGPRLVAAIEASLLVGFCAAPLLLTGCRKQVPTIAVIPRTCGTLLWEAEHTGVEREATASGLYVYWNAPMREDDVQGQIEILTHALDRGARGLIVSPVEICLFASLSTGLCGRARRWWLSARTLAWPRARTWPTC